MADKKQASLPILGIDTASPDHEVKDGKCSELHNLRYSAGAWRNVHPFVKKHSLIGDSKQTYYAWIYKDKPIYSTIRPDVIQRGDKLYEKTAIGKFVQSGFVQMAVHSNLTVIYKTDTKPRNNIFAWAKAGTNNARWWTRNENVVPNDTLYSYSTQTGLLTKVGTITNITDLNGTQEIYAAFDDEQSGGAETLIERVPSKDWTAMEPEPALTEMMIYNEEYNVIISTKDNGFDILYHHPADADNQYIATCEDEWTETYYAWRTGTGATLYTLVEPSDIKVGDALYDRPDMEFDPEYFEQTGTVAGVNTDGSISYEKETYSSNLFYGWVSEDGTRYYTRNEIPQVGDEVFAMVANTYLNSVSTITAYDGSTDEIKITVSINETETVLSRNADSDALYYFYTTEQLSLSYNGDYNHTISKSGTVFVVIEINGENVTTLQKLQECSSLKKYDINHFGNILIISDKTDKIMYYYMKSGDNYIQTDYSTVTIKAEMIKPDSVIDGKTYSITHQSRSLKSHEVLTGFENSRYYAEAVCQFRGSEVYYIDHEDLFWRGELAYFCAVRDKSGEILATTPMQIINSQDFSDNTGNEEFLRLGIKGMDYPGKAEYQGQTWYLRIGYNRYSGPNTATNIMCRPDVRISCDFGTDEIRKNISDVAVYATRIYPNIDYEKLSITETVDTNGLSKIPASGRVLKGNIHKFLMKNNLPEQPFYLAKTISIDEFTGNEYILRFDYKLLENIEQNILYKPSSSEYSYFGESLFEYNNRLHLCGIKQVFPKPKKDAFNYDSQLSDKRVVLVKYNYGDGEYYSALTEPVPFAEKQPARLTYPSSSATEMYFAKGYIATIGNYFVLAKYKLTPVASMDIAYYLNYSTSGNLRYADNVIPAVSQESVSADISACPTIGNRIQVSENNNCFVFPFANSYRIGSQTNKIIAVNSAAIEMSDSKFGEFPLYVFTEEGIFAMQSGSETLYSAIVPIAYDKAISPHTLAINYNVLFVSARGVMALSSSGIACLSAELNTKDNLIPEFLRTAKLVRLPKYNEVMAVNEGDGIAYIFSLDNKVWFTRDISIGTILNNNEMVVANSAIIDITDESDSPQQTNFCIDTRQVKLGAMELKRVETVIVRFESATAQTIGVEIYGSINLTSWVLIRTAQVTTNKDIIIRRAPMSAKYLRFRVFGSVMDDIKIMTLYLEYYFRMIHRMR